MHKGRNTAMNIVVVGAGALGSLFGGLLSKHNTVVLLGRRPHVTEIQHQGLQITGKTKLKMNVTAVDSIKDITISPDILLLTIKSYDTETAIQQVKSLIQENTIVILLQNGLDNIEKIKKYVDEKQILAGITTHGAFYEKPGHIQHTGTGKTILGELNGKQTPRLQALVHLFNESGIHTQITTDIYKELWVKAIINSSINPLTAFFQCTNGYLLENPILEKTVEQICDESTRVAQAEGIPVTTQEMIQQTKIVITETAQNHSSMLQSVQQGKQTEIDSINGKLVSIGKHHKIQTPLNEIMVSLMFSLKRT
jgi:2-dehydropantoate 2-reductase